MSRTLTIHRTTYEILSTDDGLSDRTDGDTDSTDYECEGSRGVFHESPAREAVGILTREGLTYGADGGDWFGYPDPYSDPYTAEVTETTAHLTGDWSDTERRAVVRMVSWLGAQNERRAREYAARAPRWYGDTGA